MARAHLLRTSSHCWCMKSAYAALMKVSGFLHGGYKVLRQSKLVNCIQSGTEYPRYVVEVHIKPTKPETVFTVEGVAVKLKPLFADEEGSCYFRKAASVWQVRQLYLSYSLAPLSHHAVTVFTQYSFQELSQHITSEVTRCFTEEIQRYGEVQLFLA